MTKAPVILRAGQPADLDAIVALDRATDTAPHWPIAAYSMLLASSAASSQPRYLVVAEVPAAETAPSAARLAGFAVAVLNPTLPQSTAELEDVIVTLNFRRTGIGRALCAAAIQWACSHGAVEITLEVRSASLGAIALYRDLGFLQVGRRPGYYSDPADDAVLMRLEFDSSIS
jgi:[ribosomal protein S18]-alanine N-acetyltransferase